MEILNLTGISIRVFCASNSMFFLLWNVLWNNFILLCTKRSYCLLYWRDCRICMLLKVGRLDQISIFLLLCSLDELVMSVVIVSSSMNLDWRQHKWPFGDLGLWLLDFIGFPFSCFISFYFGYWLLVSNRFLLFEFFDGFGFAPDADIVSCTEKIVGVVCCWWLADSIKWVILVLLGSFDKTVISVLIVLTFIEGFLGFLSIIDEITLTVRDYGLLWMLEVLLQCSNISSSFSFTIHQYTIFMI